MAAEFDIELPETVLNMFHYQFTWRFENVYMCGKLLDSSISGPHYGGKLLSFPWALSLGQSTKPGAKGISLFIQRTDKKSNMTVNFRAVVYKNFNVEAFFDQKFRKTFNEGDVWESPVIVTNDEFKMETMSEDVNQRWKIQVHLKWNDYLDYQIVADKYAPIVNNFMLIRRIGKHLKEFYKDEWLSDVRLKIGSETVPAHKVILAARCAYLAEKLESHTGEMIELDEDFIPCKDPEIINTFLLYLYSGDVYSIAESGPLPIGIENLAQEVKMHDLLRLTMPTFFTGRTSVKLHSASYEWMIEHSQMQDVVDESITLVSEAFGEQEIFRLYVSVGTENNQAKLTISLKLDIEQKVSLYAVFDISVTYDGDKNVLNRRAVGELSPENFLEIPDVLSVDQLLQEELNLTCKVQFSDGQVSTKVQTIPVECHMESDRPVPEFNFIRACEGWNMLRVDIGGLFDNDDYSDCSIEVGEDTVPAHRVILAARCPYFSSVFNKQEDIAGTSRGMKIYIEQDINICVYVMEVILRVLYGGFVDTTREKLRMNIDSIAKFFGLEAIDDIRTRQFPFFPPFVIKKLRIGNTLQSSNE